MAKALTAAGIARYKPSKQRREIRDSAATGLYLILQESGQRSFALRFRKPNGKPAKLTLGPVDISGVEPATAPSLDSLGAPLTLAGARQLAAEIHRQRAMGRDIVADMKATKHQRRWVACLHFSAGSKKTGGLNAIHARTSTGPMRRRPATAC